MKPNTSTAFSRESTNRDGDLSSGRQGDSTLDLSALIAQNAELVPSVEGLTERIDADDPDAFTTASAIVERGDKIVSGLAEQFRAYIDDRAAVGDFTNALHQGRADNDLSDAVERYQSRRFHEALQYHVGAFVDAVKADPTIWRNGDGELQVVVLEQIVRDAITENYGPVSDG